MIKTRMCNSFTHPCLFFVCTGSERGCETFQSEKDWHISTESLFIVMKLVRVGELNA